MRIDNHEKLDRFTKRHRTADERIQGWMKRVSLADWRSPETARDTMPGFRSIGRHRAVFKVGGDDYRIVAIVDYVWQLLEIRFVGTHEQYDRIDALTV